MKRLVVALAFAATACSNGGTITKAGPPVTTAPPLTPAQVVAEEFAWLPHDIWETQTDAAVITVRFGQLDYVTGETTGIALRKTLNRLGFNEKTSYDVLNTRQADGARTARSECCEVSWTFSGIDPKLVVTIGSR